MQWFAFGFNGFGQLIANERCASGDRDTVRTGGTKVTVPVNVPCCKSQHKSDTTSINTVRASWSRRATLHAGGDGGQVCVAGFGAGGPHQASRCGRSLQESRGCTHIQISESYLTLAFPDRVECWDYQQNNKKPVWSMEIKAPAEAGCPLTFPLVPGGYIASKSPFYRPLPSQLQAVSLALGTGHAILLTASAVIYTWGSGSHGQLGHGELGAEEEPRAVEALCGLPMASVVAGSWHSACISGGGDVYVWGWNESGQLGLPSQALRGRRQRGSQHTDTSSSTCVVKSEEEKGEEEEEEGARNEVFITIQAFPALLDFTPPCEVSKLSCGSRHTAAVTNTGDLYTWGWGEYGQLGHGTVQSCDEPGRVEFFRDQALCVLDVVCGPWNTFVCVVKEEKNLKQKHDQVKT